MQIGQLVANLTDHLVTGKPALINHQNQWRITNWY